MTYDQFEKWLARFKREDLEYLKRHPVWAREYAKARKAGAIPEGFPGRTMEILEDGSDSET